MLTDFVSLVSGSLLGYIGPGSGLELVGAVIGLAVTLGTSSLFIVLWPVRKLLRRWRGTSESTTDELAANP